MKLNAEEQIRLSLSEHDNKLIVDKPRTTFEEYKIRRIRKKRNRTKRKSRQRKDRKSVV